MALAGWQKTLLACVGTMCLVTVAVYTRYSVFYPIVLGSVVRTENTATHVVENIRPNVTDSPVRIETNTTLAPAAVVTTRQVMESTTLPTVEHVSMIAVLLPMTSRGLGLSSVESSPLYRVSLPSIAKTTNNTWKVVVYAGYDTSDTFWYRTAPHDRMYRHVYVRFVACDCNNMVCNTNCIALKVCFCWQPRVSHTKSLFRHTTMVPIISLGQTTTRKSFHKDG